MTPPTATVFLVGAGPGDPGLITVRGLELVRSADVVLYDRLVDPRLVDEAPETAQFKAGDRVRHEKFGVGMVVSASTNGSDVEYQVDFEASGVKRLLQTYAKLVPA